MTPDFFNLSYLHQGSDIQRKGAKIIEESGVMRILKTFEPVLAGTLPLDLFTDESDLDILCFCMKLGELEINWKERFGKSEEFSLQTKSIGGRDSVVANFTFGGFKFELFGQAVPTRLQSGYIHMVNEFRLLQHYGQSLRDKVLTLKQRGIKTEPAFAQALNLPGDPYKTLLSSHS